MARIAALLTVVFAFSCAASAQAATYYVRSDGQQTTGCSSPALADACDTVQEAIDEHRSSGGPGDTIDIGPGTFVGFEATQAADDDLTIRGALSGQTPVTTISPLGGADVGGYTAQVGSCSCMVVVLRDVKVDTEGGAAGIVALALNGGADLVNVHAANRTGSTAADVVKIYADGTTIARSTIEATDSVRGVSVDGGLEVSDSTIFAQNGAAIEQQSSGTRVVVRRSQITMAENGLSPAIVVVGSTTIDSSLITGTLPLYVYDDGAIVIRDSTLDGVHPGNDVSGDVIIDPSLFATVTVDSSILASGILVNPGIAGTLTCAYSDLPAPLFTGSWDVDCDTGPTGTNVTTVDPLTLFVGGSPFSWQLVAGSSAIDAGAPGPLPSGASTTDLLSAPRVAIGRAASCPTARRDRGAYEQQTGIGCPSPGGSGSSTTQTTSEPVSGPAGTRVGLSAEYVHTATQVFFGEQPARFIVDGFGHITAFAPPSGAGTVDVWAVTPIGRINLGSYTYPEPATAVEQQSATPIGLPAKPAAASCRQVPPLVGRTLAGARSMLLLYGCHAPLRVASAVPLRDDRRRRIVSQTPATGRPATGAVTVRLGYLPLLNKRR
jgi:hypothetical protein